MLAKALSGVRRALPVKRIANAYVPLANRSLVNRSLAKRTVTTDAASSHAEKEHVPEVRAFQKVYERQLLDADVCFQEDDKPFQVTLSSESFETYDLDPPPYTLKTTKKELKRMYYDMVSIR